MNLTTETITPAVTQLRPVTPPGIRSPMQPPTVARIAIHDTLDMVVARENGRCLALDASCSKTQLLLVQTIISELSRNIILHAGSGEIHLSRSDQGKLRCLCITAIDAGPGIPDIEAAMTCGFSTSGGLGLGLPGIRQMSNEFEITSEPGTGTKITATVWLV